MKEEKYDIIYIENSLEKKGILKLIENEETVTIKIFLERFSLEKHGENYFETLLEIRKELEKKYIKLLCKGCCKNVYPSGMVSSMGLGRKAYILTYGKHAKMDSLVDIFEPCLVEEYGSIEQQLKFFESWIKSLEK